MPLPMVITLAGSVMLVRLVHLEKASELIVLTPEVIVTPVREVHQLKAF